MRRRVWFTGLVLMTAMVVLSAGTASAAEQLGPFTQQEIDDHWTVDRAAPSHGWESVTYEGRQDVARVGVNSSHPTADEGDSTFHRTEGIHTDADLGTEAAVDLFVDSDWQDRAVRAGFWVAGWDQDLSPADRSEEFAIIELTTAGGDLAAGDPVVFDDRWRVWHSSVGWVDLPDVEITYDRWVTLRIAFDADDPGFDYSIDGQVVHSQASGTNSDGEAWGTDHLGEAFLNTYNYGYEDIDSSFSNASYDTFWSQAQAPPPPGRPGKRCPLLRLDLTLLGSIPLDLCL